MNPRGAAEISDWVDSCVLDCPRKRTDFGIYGLVLVRTFWIRHPRLAKLMHALFLAPDPVVMVWRKDNSVTFCTPKAMAVTFRTPKATAVARARLVKHASPRKLLRFAVVPVYGQPVMHGWAAFSPFLQIDSVPASLVPVVKACLIDPDQSSRFVNWRFDSNYRFLGRFEMHEMVAFVRKSWQHVRQAVFSVHIPFRRARVDRQKAR